MNYNQKFYDTLDMDSFNAWRDIADSEANLRIPGIPENCRLRTRNICIGQFFASYRKIMQERL